MVRSSWFDGLTMRTLLAVVAATTFFAHAAPLAADESPVSIPIGPVFFYAPEEWILLRTFTNSSTLLHPPPTAFQGIDGVSADGINGMGIFLAYAETGLEYERHIEAPLTKAAALFGAATPEDAAVAFEDIAFDALYGGLTANAGKSVARFLTLVGSVERAGYGTVLVSSSIEHADAPTSDRQFTIVALFEKQGAPFLLRIMLGTSRPLRPADLGLIDAVISVITDDSPD
jgi:hypothetical protein